MYVLTPPVTYTDRPMKCYHSAAATEVRRPLGLKVLTFMANCFCLIAHNANMKTLPPAAYVGLHLDALVQTFNRAFFSQYFTTERVHQISHRGCAKSHMRLLRDDIP